MTKSYKKVISDKDLGELLGQFYPPDPPIYPNNDTSTEEGRKWRLHTLEREDMKNYLKNLMNKYKDTGDKKYAVYINNITGGADNLPDDDK